MQNIEEKILSYPRLSVEKQREIEAYVEAHPEWAPLLQDVRSLESIVRRGDADSSSVDLATTYAVVDHLHPEEVPPGLQEAFRRLEREMENDPALRERVEAARRRIEETEAEVDPASHFEEVTGHLLEPGAEKVSSSAESTTDAPEPAWKAVAPLRSFVDELLRLPRAVRWVGAAAALLLGTYTVLLAASAASQSPLDRLAAVDVSNQVVDNYASTTTRSATPSADTTTADQLYVNALTVLRNARTSTLGLFPSYDAEKLDRAEQLLERVLDRTETGSFLALEAHYYLGKANLAQERVGAARSHFKTVVRQEGRMTEEALDILKTLQKERPAAVPSP